MSTKDQATETIRNLCGKDETYKKANAIFRLAQVKTKAGSGYDLGSSRSGLAAICAYLASERLHNGDVKYKPAQGASCLKPSDFKKAVETVEKALGEEESRKTRSSTGGLYQGLIKQHKLDSLTPVFDRWLQKYVRIAIFYWVCSLLKPDAIDLDTLMHSESVNATQCKRIVNGLINRAGSLAAQIQADHKSSSPLLPVPPTPTTPSPSKQPASPTKPPPKLRISPAPSSPSRSPTKRVPPTGDNKRKNPPESSSDSEDELTIQSQTKKQRLESVSHEVQPTSVAETPSKRQSRASKPIFGVAPLNGQFETPTKKRVVPASPTIETVARPLFISPTSTPTGRRSSRAITQESPVRRQVMVEEAMSDGDEEDGDQEEQESLRRFRPVYLGMQQWNSKDARVLALWESKKKVVESCGNPFAMRCN
ncbi:hypothetical protein BDZ89DRAFT_1082725 [Hymenopellis radicata]|nr:hypothetical protein BDZ89DRAFT_1082725 [Hymenopellis radicata]